MHGPNLETNLRQAFERDLPLRIQRVNQLKYQKVIGGHYFAAASTECLQLYRDGYMLGCIMCAQSLLEAMLKFVAKRNTLQYKKDVEGLIKVIRENQLLSEAALAASDVAWRHRNDFHHLNSGVASIDLANKARECVEATCAVEDDIFGATVQEGKLVPNRRLYWDVGGDGTAPVFLRQLDL